MRCGTKGNAHARLGDVALDRRQARDVGVQPAPLARGTCKGTAGKVLNGGVHRRRLDARRREAVQSSTRTTSANKRDICPRNRQPRNPQLPTGRYHASKETWSQATRNRNGHKLGPRASLGSAGVLEELRRRPGNQPCGKLAQLPLDRPVHKPHADVANMRTNIVKSQGCVSVSRHRGKCNEHSGSDGQHNFSQQLNVSRTDMTKRTLTIATNRYCELQTIFVVGTCTQFSKANTRSACRARSTAA